jgi:hypothetical protein
MWLIKHTETLLRKKDCCTIHCYLLRTKDCCTYSLYILKSSTWSPPELRHLLYCRISFCKPVSKKSAVCRLSHMLIPSVNSLLLKCCDQNPKPVLQFGMSIQVVVTRNKILAVRSVVKQLPVEMLQLYSSGNSSTCVQACIVMERYYTRFQHSIPFILNGLTQFI